MEEIVEKINTLREDKPYVIITESLIKQYILDNVDILIKEIEEIIKGD